MAERRQGGPAAIPLLFRVYLVLTRSLLPTDPQWPLPWVLSAEQRTVLEESGFDKDSLERKISSPFHDDLQYLERDCDHLVLAGPGAGKTSTAVALFLSSVIDTLAPPTHLVLTFTRDSRDVIVNRLKNWNLTELTSCVCTFHQFALLCLERLHASSGFFEYLPFDITNDFDRPFRSRYAFMKDSRFRFTVLNSRESAVAFVKTHLSQIAGQAYLPGPELMLKILDRDRKLLLSGEAVRDRNYVDNFTKVCRRNLTVDFLGMVYLGFFHYGDRLAEIFPHPVRVVIDEAQDMNSVTWYVVKKLQERCSRMFFLLDPNQSIYSFTGESVNVVEEIEKEEEEEDTMTPLMSHLVMNHRSGTLIVNIYKSQLEPNLEEIRKSVRREFVQNPFPEYGWVENSNRTLSGAWVVSTPDQVFAAQHVYELCRCRYRQSIGILYRNRRSVNALVSLLRAKGPPRSIVLEDQNGNVEQSFAVANSNQPEVKMTTIHRAKGGEWDVVVVLDVVDSIIPTYAIPPVTREDRKKHDLEEIRVFYVALSRPRFDLFLYVPKKIFIPERDMCCSPQPSVYLRRRIPDHWFKHIRYGFHEEEDN